MIEETQLVRNIRTSSHIGIWVVAFTIVIYLIWAATHTNNETNDYAKGSQHSEMTSTVNQYPFSFGCDRYDLRGDRVPLPKTEKKTSLPSNLQLP